MEQPQPQSLRERYEGLWQFILFGLVGFSGVFVDYGVLVLCRELFALDVRIGLFVAFPIAVTWNYELNRRFTFTSIEEKRTRSYLAFVLVCTLGLGVRYLSMEIMIRGFNMTGDRLFSVFGWQEPFFRMSYIASFIGIVIAFLFNFLGSKYFAFGQSKTQK